MTGPVRLVRDSAPPPFERFYREHFSFVWRSLSRLGVQTADVPDAVQEVFLVASRSYHELDFASRLTTWLYATCLRVASDRRRKAKRRTELLKREATSLATEATVKPGADLAALLEHGLDALPLEQRAVFTLFELDGHSGEQIAELLDVPLGTVFSRLRLARQKFRAALAGEPQEEEP